MKKLYYLILASVLLTLSGCRAKDNCELKNTGEISVTNNTNKLVEIILDNSKLFDLNPGQSKTYDKPVGNYNLKAISFPDEWSYDISVIQCETTQINIPE